MQKVVKIFTDGGARGNPGPAGIGFAIYEGDELIESGKRYIGEATNNQAEYTALLEALQKAKEINANQLHCFLDSELVVKQLNREYKVKDEQLGVLFVKIWNLIQEFDEVSFTHIRRNENKLADSLVNEAIDEALKSK